MLVRGRTVVTMDGPPIDNGTILVNEDRIVAVGKFQDLSREWSGEIVDLGEVIVLPGLINAHCHLDYTLVRGRIPPQPTFTDWIRAINAEKANISPTQYVASINEGFAEAARFGTTTIANLTAFPELIPQIRESIRTWWFAELIDIRRPDQADQIIDGAIQRLKSTSNWGLAPHAPFTASAGLYRQCNEIARQQNILLTTHLAESAEEMQMCFDLAGPLAHFLAAINPDLFQYSGQTPVEDLISKVGRIDGRWLIVHLNSISDSDANLLAAQSPKCHVIHCPRSHRYFGHPAFQFERLHQLGFNICLGTDSLASNEDLNLFSELRLFAEVHPDVAPADILELVTINPARALGQADRVGQIRPGFYADLIAIQSTGDGDPFEQIVRHSGEPDWMTVAGGCQLA